jgi:glycosyltransferase involved in cell wall biosynthesis
LARPSLLAQAREKGAGRAVELGLNIIRTQALSRVRRGRQFVFVSHTVHNTGAAQVVTEMISDFAAEQRPGRVHLVAPLITLDELRRLRAARVRTDGVAVIGESLARLQLGFRRKDFVLLNTVAIRESYQHVVLRSLETGRLEHAFWFIHEDVSQLAHVSPLFADEDYLRRIARLVEAGRLTVLVPSEQMRRNYKRLLAVDGVEKVLLRVTVDEKFTRERSPHEYDALRFLISGTPFDGRKGQPLAIAAFNELIHTALARNPGTYRDFSLVLIGIGDDYVSRQIRSIGTNVLGERLEIVPHVSRDRALEITSGCNAVICCSLNEAFGLYVAEGMAMGHVVLRNDVCGQYEQLRDGVNGFRVDSSDVGKFAGVLERVLNKSTTSNEDLQRMGRVSQQMIAPFQHHAYFARVTEIERTKPVGAAPTSR